MTSLSKDEMDMLFCALCDLDDQALFSVTDLTNLNKDEVEDHRGHLGTDHVKKQIEEIFDLH